MPNWIVETRKYSIIILINHDIFWKNPKPFGQESNRSIQRNDTLRKSDNQQHLKQVYHAKFEGEINCRKTFLHHKNA